MPFLAPTINSYKRYQTASWAPTSLAWSPDNRTAGFRIVGTGKSLRIECRIPGADVNPYLAFAGSLAAGLEGVRKGIEPPPMMSGDAYRETSSVKMPVTLNEAAHALEESKFARGAFGDDVVEHYAHYYKKEVEAFRKSVTDWEKQRYFEQI
jgi:glutamine synthetase